jgi:two-component system cell cycle response regulator
MPQNKMLTTVLLVEDNPADARWLERLLTTAQRKRYAIAWVETLGAAQRAASEVNYDAILLDLSLPDSQGLATLEAMIQTTPEVPIVVLTGLDDEKLALAALREGARDYLIKNELHAHVLTRAIYYAIERQQMLAQLRTSEARYRTIVEDRAELICRFLADGTITFANAAYCHYFGKSSQEIVGEQFFPQIPEGDWYEVRDHFAAISPNTPSRTIEHRVILPNGEVRWQQWIDRGIFDDRGNILEYQSVGRDITDLKQSQEKLHQQLAREQLLGLITQRILQSSELSEVLQSVVDQVRVFLGCDRLLACHFRPDGSSEVVVESLELGCSSTLCWSASQTHLIDRLARVGTQEEFVLTAEANVLPEEFLERFEVKAQLITPIWTNARSNADYCPLPLFPLPSPVYELSNNSSTPICLWGLLVAHQCGQTRRWQESETSLLAQVANQLALAIQQFQLYENLTAANQELKLLASVDGLTQTANRRCFDEYLQRQWQRGVKEEKPLSLILCDLDFFKRYNDCYGHLAGDRCLKTVASAIAEIVHRPLDLLARYGGEEFVVVLPDTDLSEALQVARDILARVAQLKLPHARSGVGQYVTLSLGVACTLPQLSQDSVQLIAAADEALYEAKASGRDRACYRSLLSRQVLTRNKGFRIND